MIPKISGGGGIPPNFDASTRAREEREQYGSGRCSTVSACEGEWDAVWVSGAAAQEALLFSRSHAGWEEEVCVVEGGEGASGVFDASAGGCEFGAGGVSRRRRGSGRDSCWRRTAGSSPAFGALGMTSASNWKYCYYYCCCCCSWSMRELRTLSGRDWMTSVGGSWTGGGASEGLTVTATLRELWASPLWTPRVGGTSA